MGNGPRRRGDDTRTVGLPHPAAADPMLWFPPPRQGPDFGYVTREPADKKVSGLDSFGNLEVSPPVTVRGKAYPLGAS